MRTKFLYLLLPSVLLLSAFRLPVLDFLAKLQERYQQYAQNVPQEKVYAHVDKMYYKPTDVIWFKAYIIDGNTHKPSSLSSVLYAELIDPKGNVADKQTLHISEGSAHSGFALQEATGGLYKVRVYTNWSKNFGVFEKTVQVQQFVMPNMLLTLNFPRKSHGAGEAVTADLEARDLDNMPIPNTEIGFSVSLGGNLYQENKTMTNRAGKAKIEFNLPADMQTEDGLLNVKVDYLGKSESVSRSIPLTLRNISLTFFPEGGDLVAGVRSKVAFQAVGNAGKPADISGQVLDSQGNIVSTFKSLHQGMGSFWLTPAGKETYSVQLSNPAGIAQRYNLPATQPEGFTLAVDTITKEHIQARFHSPKAETVYLVAQGAGKLHYSQKIEAQQGTNRVSIACQDLPIGILRLTLFDKKETPRAERIAFANGHKTLKIKIETEKPTYRPREEVKVKITTTDEAGKPVPANLSLAVVDDKIWTMADDKQDNMLSYLLMSNELAGKIEEPNFYFKKDEPLASVALEHLMLTRGWRRFVWKEILGEAPKFANMPEKLDLFTGRLFSAKNNKATEGYVTLVELSGLKRAMRIKTDKEGNFAFKGFDPSQQIQLVVEGKQKGEEVMAILDKNWQYVTNNGYSNTHELQNTFVVGSNPNVDISIKNDAITVEVIKPNTTTVNNNKSGGVVIRGATTLNLSADKGALSEVVVVGYGTQDIASVLSGRVAGVQVSQGSQPELDDILNGQNNLRQNGAGYTAQTADKKDRNDYRPYKALPAYQLNAKRFSFVRQYAPIAYTREDMRKNERKDFRTLIHWQPQVYTDATGTATVSFYNNDALTTFRIVAEGISANGLLGHEESTYSVQRALQVDTKLPAYATVGDTVRLGVYVRNNLPTQTTGKLKIEASEDWGIVGKAKIEVNLPAQQGETFYFTCIARNAQAKTSLKVLFESEEMDDQAQYDIEIRRTGFPTSYSFSGNEMRKAYEFSYTKAVEGSAQVVLTFFPNVLEEAMAGVEGIIREPHGCFEQVTSTAYPNIMALQYLRATGKANKEIEERALRYTELAYKKLIGYEVKGGGFDWFGQGPAQIGLTALGIMEFTDMSEVYNGVSEKMVARTREWLLNQYIDGDRFASEYGRAYNIDAQKAYVVFALAESHMEFSKFEKQYIQAYEEALKSQDAYRMVLLACASARLKKTHETAKLLAYLENQFEKMGVGNLPASTSMTGSGGNALQIETASLFLLAELLQETPNNKLANDLANYIASKRQGGMFGSTQSTVLALKSLIAYQKHFANQALKDTKIWVKLNQHEQNLTISPDKNGKVTITGLEQFLAVGKNKFEVAFTEAERSIPYTLDVVWNAYTPTPNAQCELVIKTSLASRKVKLNETVRLTATLQNKKAKTQAMSMAVVGIPSGLTAQAWQLKEMQEKRLFDYYEIHKNYVVFYYKELASQETKTISLDLKADVKGQYQAPASSGYLYYTNEFRDWIAGETVSIE